MVKQGGIIFSVLTTWIVMENSDIATTSQPEQAKKNLGPLILFVVTLIVVIFLIWQFSKTNVVENTPTAEPVIETPAEQIKPIPDFVEENVEVVKPVEIEQMPIAPIEIEPVEVTIIEEPTPTPDKPALPVLDESDDFITKKLPELTWRTELLSLLINEDMIRRFVVFTDNFAQGLLAYDHSLFKKPPVKFAVDESQVLEQQNVWQWDKKTTKRFDHYVDLLRSVDSSALVEQYFEFKPLIDEAYEELGYEDDFTNTLQDAITRVLDMELPKSSMALTRTSVMYKYQDKSLESLDDSDKLLLRIGKENLLIIKSVLLEINERLSKENSIRNS